MDRSDIKTISQLIKHLDEKYLMSRDSTNYSEKLKSMREMQSAISIVEECDRIKDEIKKEPYCFNDINLLWIYLNDCIYECYKRNEDSSLVAFSDAYINVRNAPNAESVKQNLIETATSRGIDVGGMAQKIDHALADFFKYKEEIENYPSNSNGYNQILPKLKEATVFLIENHRVRYSEFREDFPIRENAVFGDYYKKIEEERKKEEMRKSFKLMLWAYIGLIILLLLLCACVTNIWVCSSIIIVLCLLVLFGIPGLIFDYKSYYKRTKK